MKAASGKAAILLHWNALSMNRRRLASFLALLGSFLIVAGARAADQPPVVVVSIQPLHSLVAGVMEGAAKPALLIEGAASPHTYALRPSDARLLHRADAIFWIGETLESFLVKPLTTRDRQGADYPMMQAAGIRLRPYSEDGHGHGHALEQDALSARFADPHIWLDPRNAIAITDSVVAVLIEIDPSRDNLYRRNGNHQIERLKRLDAGLARRLAPISRQRFLVFHESLGYFADAYRLASFGAVILGPERQPGARRVAELRRRIVLDNIRCVFAEPEFPSPLIGAILEGTSARLGRVDTLGAKIAPGPDAYFKTMEDLAVDLTRCLMPRR